MRPSTLIALFLATSLTAVPACKQQRFPTRLAFQEVEDGAGFRFRHELPGGHLDNLPKSAMGGLAVLDYDGDGLLDVYCVNGGWHAALTTSSRPKTLAPNRLFRNRGGMRFEDVTRQAGVDDTGAGMGVCVGDVDNDGHPDLFVSNYGRSVLYRNRGDGTFEDVTDRAGIAPGVHAGAAFLDYDRDGLLDLFVSQYVHIDETAARVVSIQEGSFPGPMAYLPQPAFLYRNEGGLRFRDVTVDAGLSARGKGMSVLATDVDDDGYPDVIQANDGMPNFVWRNQGDGTFKDVAAVKGLAFGIDGQERSSMGITAADIDGDGRIDYLIPDTTGGSLYVARETWFTDRARDWGVVTHTLNQVGWSDVALDADNDGRVDIYKTHGDLRTLDPQRSRLFHNLGGGVLDIARTGKVAQLDTSARGAVAADLDEDGLADLVVLVLGGRARLFHNRTKGAGNWVRFQLVGTRSNRMAIGARVWARVGDHKRVAEIGSSTGYISATDPRVHFGLGDADEVDELTIRWPSGHVQTEEGPFEAGRTHVIEER